MARSKPKADPVAFRPAAIEPKLLPEDQWEPNLLFGNRAPVLGLTQDEPPADLDPPSDVPREDTGPGSAALASMFEALPIEWVTGEPAVETLRFELTDGLRYVGELADDETDDFQEESLLSNELTADDDRDALLSDDARADTEPSDDDLAESEPLDAEFSDIHSPEAGDPANEPDTELTEPDEVIPEGAIGEAEHLAALDAAREEALEQGRAQGLAQGLEQGREQGLAEGLMRGQEEARQRLEAEYSERQQALEDLFKTVAAATSDSHRLFAPMKRLALHLAEQLVRGELSLSGEAINRLVEHALIEVERAPGNDLLLLLNPEDLERWKRVAPASLDSLEVRADPSLSIGSVRVSAGESIIEDLVEHRLHQMAARLLGEAPARGFSRMTSLRLNTGAAEDISDVG
jgi:flagellar biosynthesis/type III secretory pathway protein FliH